MEIKRARGTHMLQGKEGSAGQDMERKRANDGHSLPGERKAMDESGPGKGVSERGAPTS
jgi:hypothetical protein